MNPWAILTAQVPQLVARLEAHPHPLLTVEVDGEVVARLVRPSRADLEAHARWPGMPRLTAEGWLLKALGKLAHRCPTPQVSVALYAGRTRVALVQRKREATYAR
ncbi:MULTISPECIES: hypothetical protein [unclassified Meiothermus]|uniref:hypothetical protein n=1 Tax=unclassified Meiothermus TaxID=370471 RepID=UPI000D7C43A4|nr:MULTISPECIES: hypothetical protein [unclassified Meiothermus]PZA06099.1 hypothetical protein DNA98_15110 [Meiothermus sp. Pnk-1]RYM35373.1 hypothetical protein EWH23_11320 [Meiothermus sp. PNK-Is4]